MPCNFLAKNGKFREIAFQEASYKPLRFDSVVMG